MLCLLNILNNATIAGVITVVVGAILAKYIYKRQKKTDRLFSNQDKLSEKLLLLKEHCDAVLLSLDMIVNTWVEIVSKDTPEKQKEFISVTVQEELKRAHDFLMYKLPEDRSSIIAHTELYFPNNTQLINEIQVLLDKINKWHTEVLKYELDGSRFPRKRTWELPELTLNEIKEQIKGINKLFRK